jgi:mannose-6-phosphate isomerase-like protein (cupin superfamily)
MEQSADSIETYKVSNAPSAESGLLAPLIVEKPWGREEWIVYNESYVMKLLYVTRGESLSKQYHEEKMETLKLLEGKCNVIFGHEGDLERDVRVFTMDSRDNIALHINPRTIHRFEAIEDSLFVEVSTPQVGDVVRLEDRYNRPTYDDVVCLEDRYNRPATHELEQQVK